MEAKLVLRSDKHKPTVLKLKKLPMTLGRGREASLTVAHPMISRLHCEFFEVENTLCIRDLGSLNGTFVGGIRIEEASLESGDILMVGSAEFEIVIEEDQALMPPPSPIAEADTRVGAQDDEGFVEIDVDFPLADDLSEDFSEVVELEDVGAAANEAPKRSPQPATRPAAVKKPAPQPQKRSASKPSKSASGQPAAKKPAQQESKAEKSPKSPKATPTKKVSTAKTISFESGSDATPSVKKDDDLNNFLTGLQ